MTQFKPIRPEGVPPWLFDLLMTPPTWFKYTLFFVAGALFVLVALRVYERDIYISLDEQRDMVLILGTVEAVAVGVVLSINVLSLGFAGNVLVGLAGGFAVVEVVRRLTWLLPQGLDDEKGVVVTAWAIVAVSAFALPDLVFPHNRPYYLGLKVGVAGIAALMCVWALLQEFGPVDTIGEMVRRERAE